MTESHSQSDLLDHKDLLAHMPKGWTLSETKDEMSKTFEFANFASAFGWMTHVALVSEKMNHHPQMLYTYRIVEATLTTHDAGGLTQKDIKLAHTMNEAAGHA
ncbi:4a-hydroxytetrahydrobiopterin dehydratase [Pacificibacter marinus]|uniref:Putative pterin-4-alpha-carbinolamine dehydratase n=1 Tax=Pacificibacter marinus TaxID=658057 RepID=A0A1Y5S3I0_9RHOB|nr:4a-hydroxytetrahydrobiopterin dehydratase [Pacificibacter marinus]SEK91005.1 4a-hydroxytetrahydrobiopterin dehydratase [Pacificibacter marinus]SLN31836.1 Putative pterin-4-alpha-carbinolamine dehydratase [Pacificibacter marinus]